MKSCGNNYHFEDRKRKTFVKQDWNLSARLISTTLTYSAKSTKSDKIGKLDKLIKLDKIDNMDDLGLMDKIGQYEKNRTNDKKSNI